MIAKARQEFGISDVGFGGKRFMLQYYILDLTARKQEENASSLERPEAHLPIAAGSGSLGASSGHRLQRPRIPSRIRFHNVTLFAQGCDKAKIGMVRIGA
jgi:hypothetical protein